MTKHDDIDKNPKNAVIICPLRHLDDLVTLHQPSHVISILSASNECPKLDDQIQHLYLNFNDITVPRDGYISPQEQHIHTLIDFAQSWDRSAPMIVHCWAGVSRSTAAAFILLCAFSEKADEFSLANHLREKSPPATPNTRMVSLADNVLRREGRMSKAIDTIGRGAYAFEGNIFTLAMPPKI